MRDRRVRVFIDQSYCKYWSQTNSFLRKARTQRPTVGKKQAIYFTLSFDKYFLQGLCISQFQLHPAPPPPPPSPLRATVGHLPALSVPGVWHLQILHCPGARHLPNPGPTPSFWHAHSFLSEYNYTEDFTWKTSRLAHLSRMGKNWRGLLRHVLDFMHTFLHCLSSQNYIAKLGSYRRESTFFFGHWI